MHSHCGCAVANNPKGHSRCLPYVGQQLVRAASGLRIVSDRHQHDFICLKLLSEAQQFLFYLSGRADGPLSSVFF